VLSSDSNSCSTKYVDINSAKYGSVSSFRWWKSPAYQDVFSNSGKMDLVEIEGGYYIMNDSEYQYMKTHSISLHLTLIKSDIAFHLTKCTKMPKDRTAYTAYYQIPDGDLDRLINKNDGKSVEKAYKI
jgi:hypothetical protein